MTCQALACACEVRYIGLEFMLSLVPECARHLFADLAQTPPPHHHASGTTPIGQAQINLAQHERWNNLGIAAEDCARGQAQDDALCGFPIMVSTQRLVAAPGGGEESALVASAMSRFLRASG